jgi:hypothetical protein
VSPSQAASGLVGTDRVYRLHVIIIPAAPAVGVVAGNGPSWEAATKNRTTVRSMPTTRSLESEVTVCSMRRALTMFGIRESSFTAAQDPAARCQADFEI